MRLPWQANTPARLSLADIRSAPDVASLGLPTPDVPYPELPAVFAVQQYALQGGNRGEAVRAVTAELVANAITHGNQYRPNTEVRLHCLWRNLFYVAVRDDGIGFNVDDPPFVPGRSGMPPEGGLGLIVARQKSAMIYTDGSAVIGVFGR